MRVKIIEDAQVLIPNSQHKNFTESSQTIKKGSEIDGEQKLIKGKRRGEDFTYSLFMTDDNKLIYFKKIKPMQTTEVTLGADATQTPTVVSIPETKKLITKQLAIYSLIGAGVGFGFSKYKKYSNKKAVIFAIGGAVIGFAIGKYVEKRKGVSVKASV